MKAEEMNRFQTEANRLKSAPPSLPVLIALLALRFYKTYLSFLFAGNCRFDPTCSQYAYQAIERFGVLGGVWLGMKRLLRCHPLSRKFGYDPVPETWDYNSLPPQTAACDALNTFREEDGFDESRVTSLPRASKGRESLLNHSCKFRIQDEVHS